MTPGARRTSLGLLVLLAGCGSRSGLYDDPLPDAATTPDVPAGTDVLVVTDVPGVTDVPVVTDAGPCRWQAGPAQVLTPQADFDRSLTAVIPHGAGALVAWDISNDPAPMLNRMVLRVDAQGAPVGQPQPVLLRQSGVSHGGVSLADQGGLLAAAGWDAAGGCRFVRLTSEGASAGPETRVGTRNCNRLAPVAGQFELLEAEEGVSAAAVPVRLARSGAVVRRGESLVPRVDNPFWTARRLNGAGDMLSAWMPGNLAPTRVMARVYSEDGTPRGAAVTVAELTAPATRVAAIPTPGGYLLGWTRRVGPDDQQHTIETAPVDALARSLGRPAAVMGTRVWRDAGFALLPYQGAALMAWVESDAGTDGRLRFVPLTPQGDRAGDDLVVTEGRFMRRPALVATAGGGVLVVYEAPGQTFRRVLFAQPLRCVR